MDVFCLNCRFSRARDPNGSRPLHPMFVWCEKHCMYKSPEGSCEFGQL